MVHARGPGPDDCQEAQERDLGTWLEGTLHCDPDNAHSCQNEWGPHLDSLFPPVKPMDPHTDPENYAPEEVNHGLWRAIAYSQDPLKLRV